MLPLASSRSWSNTAPKLLAIMVSSTTPDIDDSFTRIDDALFNLAQQQGSNGGVLMDGLRLMRANRSSLVAEWGELIRQSIDEWGQPKEAITVSGLSLVNDDDLERSLAVDQMAEVFAKTHERDFSHLNQAWMAIAETLTAASREQDDLNSTKNPVEKKTAEKISEAKEGETLLPTDIHRASEIIMVADCPAHPHGLAVLVGRLVDKLNLNLDARLTVLKTFERSLGNSLKKMLAEIISMMVEDGWMSRHYTPAVNEQRKGQPRQPRSAAANTNNESSNAERDRERDDYEERQKWIANHPESTEDEPSQVRWGGDRRRLGGSYPRYPGPDRRASMRPIPDRPLSEEEMDEADMIGADMASDGMLADDFVDDGIQNPDIMEMRDERYPMAPRGWMEQNMAYGFTPYGFAPYGFAGGSRGEETAGRRMVNRHGYDHPSYEKTEANLGDDGNADNNFAAGIRPASRKQLANDLTLALSRLLGSSTVSDEESDTSASEDEQLEIDPDQIDPAAAQLVALLQRRRAADRPVVPSNGEVKEGATAGYSGHMGPPISAEAVRSVLDVLQREMPEPVRHAARANDSSLAQQFKDEMLHKAKEIGVAVENSHLEERDEDAVDVVGMLFEVFLSERSMTEDTREHIARLVAPYIKAALSDRKLFLQRTHPARRLLDSLAEACDGNMGSTTQERDILSRVARAIDEVVRVYNEDEAIFSEAEKEIRDFITSQRRVAHLAEQRAEQVLKGKERLEEAKTDSQAFFEKTLGDRNWPVRTLELLRSYWCQHHTMTILRNEPGADEVDSSKRLLGGLIDIGTRGVQKASDHVRALHLDVITMLGSSGLMDQSAVDAAINLWGALDQAGQWTALARSRGSVAAQRTIPEPPKAEPTDTAVAFALFQAKQADELLRRQAQEEKNLANKKIAEKSATALKASEASADGREAGDISTDGKEEASSDVVLDVQVLDVQVLDVQVLDVQVLDVQVLDVQGTEVSTAAAETKPAASTGPDQPTLDALTDYFDNMPVGSWVDFIDEYGRTTAAKLSWISPISRKRLFVTIRGLRHSTETPDDLAMMVAMKRLKIRDVGIGEYGFDHSYRKALEELDQRVAAVG